MGAYTFNVLDTSPIISYLPVLKPEDLDAQQTQGWVPYYTTSGFAQQKGLQGNGESMHIAYLNQSRVSVDWTGTDIQLHGNVTNATYSIVLDGQPISQPGSPGSDGLLANISGLSQGPHTLALFAHLKADGDPTSFVCFQKAVLTSQTTATATTQPVDDHEIAFRGEWSFTRETTSNTNATFHTSTNQGDEAILSFHGTGIAVSGFTNITSGPYNVTLDGDTTTFDGKSTFAQPTVLFFQSGLDSRKVHSLTITNAASALLMVGAIDITTSSGSPSTAHGISRGTAAGIAVACVLAFLALLALTSFLFFRRRSLPDIVTRVRQLFRRRPTYRDYESEFDGHVIRFTRNEKVSPLSAPGEMSPGSMFFPPAVMPIPPRQYAPKNQRFSATTWKSTLAPSDSYSAPPKRLSERRRGSKTLLLGSPQDDSPYLTFGRSGHRPPDIKVLSQPLSHIEVLDIRAPSIRAPPDANSHSHGHQDSFLDIQSSASPSASATNTGSERSSRRVTRGSHTSRPASGSSSIPGGLKALFNRSSKASRHSRSGSGSTPSFPYPFEQQGIHGSVIDGVIPADVDSQSESDIHFRALEDMTDTDGMRTRPVSQPAANPQVANAPTTAIVQRLLGLESAVPATARIVRSPPITTSPAGPSAWPRALASGFGAGPLSPTRTNAPAGPRPPSIVRR